MVYNCEIMINLSNISLHLGSRLLFEDVNLTIFDQQKVALVGANGSGKSSFFKLLLGEYQPDGGQVNIPKNLRLAHLAQDVPPLAKSALDFVLDGDRALREIEHSLQLAEQRENHQQIALLHEKFAEIDGYSAPARAAKLLDGSGFQYRRPTKSCQGFFRWLADASESGANSDVPRRHVTTGRTHQSFRP